MKHPNAVLLEKLYANFAEGNLQAVLDACSDEVTFNVPGKSRIAGKFTKKNFIQDFVMKLGELSGGTIRADIHDILASDRHAAVLATDTLMRDGKKIEFRSVHIWRFDGGKPVAWYVYPRDLYQFDEIWA